MDNRGYDGRASGLYASRIPPPVYTVTAEVDRPRRHYDRRRDSVSTSDISSRPHHHHHKYTVEDPPDGGVWAWIIVLACGVLHLCSELVYYIFYDTIVIGRLRNVRLVLYSVAPESTYEDFQVFEDVRLAGVMIAAIASVFVGYRIVAVFGSVLVLAGFLSASFVNPGDNIELMGFLVGFLGGLGCAFWRFTAIVAVLEYFKKWRLTAIILSGFGRVIGIFIGYAILAEPLRKLRDADSTKADIESMTHWHIYYKCVCAPAGVAFFTSMAISPLPLIKDHRHIRDCVDALKLRSLSFCRAGILLLTLTVYGIYYFGENLPMPYMIYWMDRLFDPLGSGDRFTTEHILIAIFLFACGVTVGYVILAFWPSKKKFHPTMITMGCILLVLGLLTLQLPMFHSPYISYIAAYTAILGAAQVIFESILRYVIPIAFSRQYIRWVEGLLGLFAGSATIANNFIADSLDEKEGGINNVFYFAGSAFLFAGLIAVVVINVKRCFRVKDVNLEKDVPLLRTRKSRYITQEELRESRREDDQKKFYYNYQFR